jgi:hypothetical protein
MLGLVNWGLREMKIVRKEFPRKKTQRISGKGNGKAPWGERGGADTVDKAL